MKGKMWLPKVFAFLAVFQLSFVSSYGQEIRKGDCTPLFEENDLSSKPRKQGVRRLPGFSNNWDASKTYRQLVILFSFSDVDFKNENPRELYDSIFNVKGYNQRQGVGCVAEYFSRQSNGMFNMAFDVYGPYKVSTKAQPYNNPNEQTRNFGRNQMIEATNQFIKENPDIDFSVYDWNGNGKVNQVIYVYAGYCGNQSNKVCYGHIWPNTSTFSTITTPDGLKIINYTASGEHWADGKLCGIGTICHEFSHSLGLPDIYPTTDSGGYSVLDEWDLMDGGNFTNYGWCPPNYTPLEKMLLNWVTPVELTEPQIINNLKPSDDGGEVYRIMHSDSEWLLLENRQQKGWDLGVPGKGLLIYHVNYDGSVWSGNTVNNDAKKQRFHLFNADNMNFDDWYAYVVSWAKPKQYANSDHMNSYFLSSSPYPWRTDSTDFVNDSLTSLSVPAAVMNYPNIDGETMLSSAITNIVQNEDGTISFRFKPRCADPTITYEKGQLHFECDTEGATFVSKVMSDDMQEREGSDISLSNEYTIAVYATAEGYTNSRTVTATIKWGDGKIKTENIDVISTTDSKADVNQDGAVDVADISTVITVMADGEE